MANLNNIKQEHFKHAILNVPKENIPQVKKEHIRQYQKEFHKKYRKKFKHIMIRVLKTRIEIWEKLAKENKMKPGTLILKSAEAYLAQEFLLLDKTTLDNFIYQLSGVCNNINQIAKKVNTFGEEKFNEAELKYRVTEVENILYKMFTEPKTATGITNSLTITND